MNTAYLQLQSTIQNIVLLPDQFIRFDIAKIQSGDWIHYSDSIGSIYINQVGIYYVSWSVAVAMPVPSPVIDLRISDGRIIKSSSSLSSDMVTGSAIITVDMDTVGMQLSLCNGSEQELRLADVPVVANLFVRSIEMNRNNTCDNQALINFSNGSIDYTKVNSYPMLLEVGSLANLSQRLIDLQISLTLSGLETLLGLSPGTLANPISLPIEVAAASIVETIEQAAVCVTEILEIIAANGLVSLHTYIGHANGGVVPSLAANDVAQLTTSEYPPYPQMIARDGMIASFTAEFNCLMALDSSLVPLLSEAVDRLNIIIADIISKISTFISALYGLAGTISALGITLPDQIDELFRPLIPEPDVLALPQDCQVHATLWKGIAKEGYGLSENAVWQKAAELNLGNIYWEELPLFNAENITKIGDLDIDRKSWLDTAAFLQRRGDVKTRKFEQLSMGNHSNELEIPISVGEYLMVQYTLVQEESGAVLAGVIASDAMASVLIR